jgi:hypothetical protein
MADVSKIDFAFGEQLKRDLGSLPNDKQQITDEFLECFETIVSAHDHRWLHDNRSRLSGKRCILRTIGQFLPEHETAIRSLEARNFEIVRYSPAEQRVAGYAGHDAIIRFYKDPDEYGGFTGSEPAILCFGNSLLRRPHHVMLSFMIQATAGFDFRLYGGGNRGLTAWRGMSTAEEVPALYRSHRVYYSHHTLPACYTLSFIEALMSGIPVVAPGLRVVSAAPLGGSFREMAACYEAPTLIENGRSGWTPNTVEEAHHAFASMVADREMAATIGAAGRRTAVAHFALTPVREAWRRFLG